MPLHSVGFRFFLKPIPRNFSYCSWDFNARIIMHRQETQYHFCGFRIDFWVPCDSICVLQYTFICVGFLWSLHWFHFGFCLVVVKLKSPSSPKANKWMYTSRQNKWIHRITVPNVFLKISVVHIICMLRIRSS